jgi:hypothetical protein
MVRRDNADDYLDGGLQFLQAWTILGDCECPPSREVFEHGFVVAAHERKGLKPQMYAHQIVAKYGRTDADRVQKQPWWRWSEAEGRLKPA